MKKVALALGAIALVGAPVLAQSAPAVAPVEGESEIGGSAAGLYAAAFIAGIVAMAVLVATDDDDEAVSP